MSTISAVCLQVGRLAAHVGAGQDHDARPVERESQVVGNEGLRQQAFHHRVAAFDVADFRLT